MIVRVRPKEGKDTIRISNLATDFVWTKQADLAQWAIDDAIAIDLFGVISLEAVSLKFGSDFEIHEREWAEDQINTKVKEA